MADVCEVGLVSVQVKEDQQREGENISWVLAAVAPMI